MKLVLMSLILVMTSACTTIGFTSTQSADSEAPREGLRERRQKVLLESFESGTAQ